MNAVSLLTILRAGFARSRPVRFNGPTVHVTTTRPSPGLRFHDWARPAGLSLGMAEENTLFGPYQIAVQEQVFVRTALSQGLVNLKPLVPGHVLIIPRRVVPRFEEMLPAEVSDLWLLAQRVGRALESYYAASSLTLSIQDGPDAGQSVPHVHIHVLPRKPGDFARNDDIYEALEKNGRSLSPLLHSQAQAVCVAPRPGQKLDLDIERPPRTKEEMSQEAAALRKLF